MTTTEAAEQGDGMERLCALDRTARNHDLPTEVTTYDSGQHYFIRLDRAGRAPARVYCRPRAIAGGVLWFFGDGGVPICDACEIATALEWLRERAAASDADVPPLVIAAPTTVNPAQ